MSLHSVYYELLLGGLVTTNQKWNRAIDPIGTPLSQSEHIQGTVSELLFTVQRSISEVGLDGISDK
jgi:hypothetical protein